MVLSKNYSVQIPVSDIGGFGDIIAGVSLAEYFQTVGLEHKITFTSKTARDKYELVLGERMPNDEEKIIETSGISIYPIRDDENHFYNNPDSKIVVNEYNYSSYGYVETDLGRKIIALDTGFGCKPNVLNLSSGIYFRPSLDFLVQASKTAIISGLGLTDLRHKTLDSIESFIANDYSKKFIEKQRERIALSHWALYYPSSIGDSYGGYFEILKTVEKKLTQPLVVISTTPTEEFENTYQKKTEKFAKQNGFNYFHLNQENLESTSSSPITFIEVGSVPEKIFMQLISQIDTLSLITGDHSLSQVIQRNLSGLPLPFVYKTARWKRKLVKKLSGELRKHNKLVGDLFQEFSDFDRSGLFGEFNFSDYSSLVINGKAISEFNEAVCSLPTQFVSERERLGVEYSKKLWCIQETVGTLVQRLHAGLDMKDAIKPFLTEWQKKEFL